MAQARDDDRDTSPEPDWGLGAVADPVAFGEALLDLGQRLARDPGRVVGAGARLAVGLADVAAAVVARSLGAATAEGPAVTDPADTRFGDPAWEKNPVFYGLRQSYLLWAETMRELAVPDGNGELAGKAEFVVAQIVDALAPTNFLPGNPTALKRAFETGGASVARGFRQFLDAAAHNGGWPQQVDAKAFVLGENLAASPGKVVFRNELIELIQYAPKTETVFETPLLLSPPWINKYYVMDLAPGKSFAEWAIDHGHTVFAISYRNPDSTMRDVGLEDYLRLGLLAAVAAIGEITGVKEVNLASLCLGGTLTAVLLAHLADPDATGPRVRSATLLNTLVDFSEPGALGHFVDETTVKRLEKRMAKDGFLPADQMAGTFNLLRANDLIWRYVASGWLMGEDPPAFDILAWNDDSTRMPARMHSEYLRFDVPREPARRGHPRDRRARSSPSPTAGRGLRSLRARGPHHAVARLLPHDRSGRRPRPLRADVLGAHRGHRQSAEPEAHPLAQRGAAARRGRVARRGNRGEGVVVGGLGAVDRRPRGQAAEAADARKRGASTAR